jgi:Flp pilus assembly protein TadG
MPTAMPATTTGRWRRLLRDDRGSTAVEFAIGAPILMGVVVLLLQMSAWGMANLAARSAADHAVQSTRVVGGSSAAGQADATALLSELGGSFFSSSSATVSRGAAVTTVTVRGRVRGLPIPVTVTVQAPTERFVP